MKNKYLFGSYQLVLGLVFAIGAFAEELGDQIIDGIGETALVTRHVFRGDERDSSRNAQHAMLQGQGSRYVRDPQFDRVLALPGGNGAYVQMPGLVLQGLDTLSVSVWFWPGTNQPAPLFSFGVNASSNYYCGPVAGNRYGVGLTAGAAGDYQLSLPALPTNRWMHLAVVLDAAHRTLTAYVDGVKAGALANVMLSVEHVANTEHSAFNRVFIGRSQDNAGPRLNALIHDFRIYSIALSERQVAGIRANALSRRDSSRPDGGATPTQQPMHGSGIAQPMAALLTGVADVNVETTLGVLPRLPYFVSGQYRNGAKGPDVRVIWPAATNNAPVLTTGVYTVGGRVPGSTYESTATVTVKAAPRKVAAPKRTLETFPLGSVTLLPDTRQRPSPFIKNRDKFIKVLAETNPDRFLYMFRDAFGQPQPPGAEPLGGWDSQTTRLRGHATGHYLSAIAQAYAGTGYDLALQARLRQKMDYLIATLYGLAQRSGNPTNAGAPFNADPLAVPFGPGKANFNSDLSSEGIRRDYWNWGEGFISAYPPDQFIMLEQGAFYGGNNQGIWAPYYTLHKILAGLLDCYEVGGNPQALALASGMAQWVGARLQALPEATRTGMWSRYIAGEYGGMNEVLARLSRLTGDTRFLATAKLFDNTSFFFGDAQHSHGLARNVDTIRGKHANQHIPQIIGALETYRDAGDPEYWRIARNFWDITTHSYLYSIGGVAGARNPNNAECFPAQPDSLFEHGFASGGQNETCATYNLLKLSRQLFLFEPEARYMDYYEQAFYNHILASVAENDAGNTYHVPLNPAARKQFGNAGLDGFTCCNGTALESHTKLQDTIYFHSADQRELYVNLFVASELKWAARKTTVTQQTDFPYADATSLTVKGGGSFVIRVRVPQWATRGFLVTVNGQPRRLQTTPGRYVVVGTKWKNGDVIGVRMPFGFRLSPVMDQPNLASLFYGPVLLAAEEFGPRANWRPITLSAEDLGKTFSGDPQTLRFQAGDANFRPFFETYGRHSVYLDVDLK